MISVRVMFAGCSDVRSRDASLQSRRSQRHPGRLTAKTCGASSDMRSMIVNVYGLHRRCKCGPEKVPRSEVGEPCYLSRHVQSACYRTSLS
jgi:hypothetical protein